MKLNSVFKERSSNEECFPQLKENKEVEIAIIGGGITGMICAYLLNENNVKCILLEALRIGDGTTGFSSAHLTTDLDFGYQNLYDNFGSDTIKLVAESRIKGIELIERIIKENNISCGFERVDGYYFTENKDDIKSLEKEFKYAQEAGLDVYMHSSTPLPFTTHSSIQFKNQAQFDSQKFLNGIAKVLQNSNCEIYEDTRVVNMYKDQHGTIVETTFGIVTAKKVIMATHTPLFLNVIQSMIAPYTSYAITARLKDDNYPKGLFWDTNNPYFYIRTYTDDKGPLLIVGGADHKAGHQSDSMESFKSIESYITNRFNIDKIINRWSGEYFESSDGLPYIGLSHFSDNIYVATGFSGDGLVYGAIAAKNITDLITEKENEWLKIYDVSRFTPKASFKTFVTENIDNAKHFIKDRITSESEEALNNLEKFKGEIITINGQILAVSKDENNILHAISPYCSHLKCVVQWNSSEQTWVCPCHGSKFSNEGKILYGPAVDSLEKINLNDLLDKNNKNKE